MEKTITGWHFVASNRLARDGITLIEPGYTYSTDEPNIVPCFSGLHLSENAIDALKHAPGLVVCRCELTGELVSHGDPIDKWIGRERTVLWMADATNVVLLWTCWCVRQIWDQLKDERSKRAIEVVELFVAEQVSREEVKTAANAANAAYDAYASYAAYAAAYAANAATNAAANAANAANAAAYAANAANAAAYAAYAAAYDAANAANAANDAADMRKRQQIELETRLLALEPTL
jgi:hypothetical protein